MADLRILQDVITGEQFFPYTHESAVVDKDGRPSLEILKSDLSEIENAMGKEKADVELTLQNGYVKADGTVNTSLSGYYHTQNIDCTGITEFFYTGYVAGSAMWCAVFFNNNNNVVDTQIQGTGGNTGFAVTEEVITVPSDASYVVFNHNGTSECSVSCEQVTNVKAELNKINSVIAKNDIRYDVISSISCFETIDGYVKADGTINDNSTWKHTEWIPTEGMNELYYTGWAYYGSPYCVVFRDKNEKVVGAFLTGTSTAVSYEREKITIPTDAYEVAFTWYNIAKYPDGKAEFLRETTKNNADLVYPYLNKKWVCVGDSLTAINNSASEKYHKVIADELGFNVINMGDGGTGYMKGFDSNRAFYQRVLSCPSDADVVTVFGSGNDLTYFDNLGDYTDTTTDTICGCVNTFLDNFFSICPTVPIGIIAPTPWANTPTTTNNSRMRQYVEKLKQIADYRGVPFLNLYNSSNLRPENETQRGLLFYSEDLDGNGDGVHPNNLGHKLIAPKIREFVKTLI